MICKYCGAQYTGRECTACGKVMPLMKRSTELDVLMSGIATTVSRTPHKGKTYEQGVNEGYQKGLTEGYSNGYADAVTKKTGQSNMPIQKMALLCAVIFVVAAVLSGLIFGTTGYNRGYSQGSIVGKDQGQEAGIRIASSTFEPLLSEYYDNGHRDGYATAKAELIAQMVTPAPEPTITESTATPMPENHLEFPYSVENNGRVRNNVVRKIQNRLIDLKIKVDGKVIAADGLFGRNTEKAVKLFQKANGLEITGEVDLITYQHLFPEEQQQVSDNEITTTSNMSLPDETPFVPVPVTPTPFVQETVPSAPLQTTAPDGSKPTQIPAVEPTEQPSAGVPTEEGGESVTTVEPSDGGIASSE